MRVGFANMVSYCAEFKIRIIWLIRLLGPNCRNKHVRKLVCQNYLTGFCPDGLNCPNGHPKYELPVMYNTQNDGEQAPQQQSYHSNHNTHGDKDHHPKPYNRPPQQHFQPQNQQQNGQQQQQGFVSWKMLLVTNVVNRAIMLIDVNKAALI